MIKTYRKKPVEIEALEWTGENHEEVAMFLGYIDVNSEGSVVIATLEGSTHASVGDFIIRGVKREFYACKPDIFEMTYTEVPFFMSEVSVNGA